MTKKNSDNRPFKVILISLYEEDPAGGKSTESGVEQILPMCKAGDWVKFGI